MFRGRKWCIEQVSSIPGSGEYTFTVIVNVQVIIGNHSLVRSCTKFFYEKFNRRILNSAIPTDRQCLEEENSVSYKSIALLGVEKTHLE